MGGLKGGRGVERFLEGGQGVGTALGGALGKRLGVVHGDGVLVRGVSFLRGVWWIDVGERVAKVNEVGRGSGSCVLEMTRQ